MTDDRWSKAFDFAQDTTKQVLTLSTGIIALTITFIKEIAGDAPESAMKFIEISWVLYLASILAGLLTLMALTGSLGELKEGSASVYERSIRIVAGLQLLCFLGGLVLTVVFGVKAL